MKNKNRTALLGLGVFLLLGCAAIIVLLRAIYASPPPAPIIQPSPLPPEAINTMIVQTGVAAASQTAGVSGTQTSQLYTPTYTMTITPLGGAPIKLTGTPLPDGSIPNLVFETSTRFVLAKWTPSVTATSKPKNGRTSDGKKTSAEKTKEANMAEANDLSNNKKHLSCNVLSTNPAANSIFTPNQNFNVTWKVKNSGSDWSQNSIDLAYGSGAIGRFADIYNLGADVGNWQQYIFNVPMQAPGTAGKYSALWYLRSGKIKFCELKVSIIVQ